MNVRYSHTALQGLTLIGERTTALRGKRTAKEVGKKLRIILEKDLPAFPFRGREGRVAGTRELLLTPLPYLVVYRVGSDTVEILAIFHQAQDRAQEP